LEVTVVGEGGWNPGICTPAAVATPGVWSEIERTV
jgi:hypothetical protein